MTPNIPSWVGVVLAISSGVFIGSSYIIKKKALLKSNEKGVYWKNKFILVELN